MEQGNCELCGLWDGGLVEGLCEVCARKCQNHQYFPKVIGIAGPARVGKDTVADIILNKCPCYRKASFADPIKSMLQEGLGLSVDQLYGNEKETVDPRYGHTPRHLMQTLGTEWGRQLIDDNLWVKAMAERIGRGIVIPDVRFENEADFVRQHGVLIHITGRGGIEGDHISEMGVKYKPEDTTIYNGFDFETLEGIVGEMVCNYLSR